MEFEAINMPRIEVFVIYVYLTRIYDHDQFDLVNRSPARASHSIPTEKIDKNNMMYKNLDSTLKSLNESAKFDIDKHFQHYETMKLTHNVKYSNEDVSMSSEEGPIEMQESKADMNKSNFAYDQLQRLRTEKSRGTYITG
jgi:hypothetical protein